MQPSTVKKDPNRAKPHAFPLPAQANKAFTCSKAEAERKFVESSSGQMPLLPVISPSDVEILTMRVAARLAGYERDVI